MRKTGLLLEFVNDEDDCLMADVVGRSIFFAGEWLCVM